MRAGRRTILGYKGVSGKETEEVLRALQEVLEYVPDTGKMYWKMKTAKRVKVGSEAGGISNEYIAVRYSGRLYQGHRIAWALFYGAWPEKELDHINGDKLDNRIVNLREVTHRQNGQNQVTHRNGKLCGTALHKDKELKGYLSCWQARIKVNGTLRSLGYYSTEQEAYEVYLKACEDLIQVESHYGSRKEDDIGA